MSFESGAMGGVQSASSGVEDLHASDVSNSIQRSNSSPSRSPESTASIDEHGLLADPFADLDLDLVRDTRPRTSPSGSLAGDAFDDLPDPDEDIELEAVPDDENPTEKAIVQPGGALIGKLPTFYESRGRLAQVFRMGKQQFDLLLLHCVENSDLLSFLEQYQALTSAAPAPTTSGVRGRGVASNSLALLYITDTHKYFDPSGKEKAAFNRDEYVIHFAAKMMNQLERSKVFDAFDPPITPVNKWTWGYMFFMVAVDLAKKAAQRNNGETWFENVQKQCNKRADDATLRHQMSKDATTARAGRTEAIASLPGLEKSFLGQAKRPSSLDVDDPVPPVPSLEQYRALAQARITSLDLQERTRRLEQTKDGEVQPLALKSSEEVAALLTTTQGAQAVSQNKVDKYKEPDPVKELKSLASKIRSLKDNPYRSRLYNTLSILQNYFTFMFFKEFVHVDVVRLERDILAGQAKLRQQIRSLDKASSESLMPIVQDDIKMRTKGQRVGAATKGLMEAGVEFRESLMASAAAKTPSAPADFSKSSKMPKKKKVASSAATVPRRSSRSSLPKIDTEVDVTTQHVLNMSLPDVSTQHKEAAERMAKLVDGPEFQRDYLADAIAFCQIDDARYLRMPHQSMDYVLKWWQLISIKWTDEIRGQKLTRGGLNGDYIGLGKTIEYTGQIHLVSLLDACLSII